MTAAKSSSHGGSAVVPMLDDWAKRQLLICARYFTVRRRRARLFVDQIATKWHAAAIADFIDDVGLT
jgi:hypothetical protein